MFRTDENNNPTAFTVDVADEAGLIEGTDYVPGTPFPSPSTLVTAKLLGDPIAVTIKVINRVGFYVGNGPTTPQRWGEIAMVYGLWARLTVAQKTAVIGIIYIWEGGTAMEGLFA
jgi:hypothetical protein